MRHIWKALLLIVVVLLLASCSKKPEPQSTAEKYFQEGERYFESNLYDDAIASWEKVRDTFYSPELGMLAELKIAEAYYITERYSEAATIFEEFLKQHPNDFRAATVLYRLGLSYYQQILPADRDQTNTRNALQTFQELVRRFPTSRDIQEASHLILRCKTRLAEHEVYVGAYYVKKKYYQPAITRLEAVLTSFPDYYYRDEVYFHLGKAFLETDQEDKAKDLFDRLCEEFPGSRFTTKAKKLWEKKH